VRDPVATVEFDPVEQTRLRVGEFRGEHLGEDSHDEMGAVAWEHVGALPRDRDAVRLVDGCLTDASG
jgi:hypothetical protein